MSFLLLQLSNSFLRILAVPNKAVFCNSCYYDYYYYHQLQFTLSYLLLGLTWFSLAELALLHLHYCPIKKKNVSSHPLMSRYVDAWSIINILIDINKCSAWSQRNPPCCKFRVVLKLSFRLRLGLLYMSPWGEELRGHFMTFILRISCQKWLN